MASFYLVYILSVIGAATGAAGINTGSLRSKFPSMLKTIDTVLKSSTVEMHTLASANVSANNTAGLVYMEFYSIPGCDGPVSYSSGYRADFCLPANDYVRPPFSNDDEFYYTYPFKSIKISNVTEACDSWFITYYTDALCTTVYNVTRTADFTECKPAGSLQVSNLVSVQGKCSLSALPPVQATSYLVSDYTGKRGCAENELVSYTAYSTGTCFGYGNYSSTYFSANITADSVHETQYYKSTNCTRSANAADQSDYTIPASQCNAVQTPGYPLEDDTVAWTEYTGVDLVVVPTAAPTARPSAQPSARPSFTAAPTANDHVLFAAQQVITGIDLATYNAELALYSATLKVSIASCMANVNSDNIINLVVTSTPTSSSLRSLSATPSISAAYQVSVYDSNANYDDLSAELINNVVTGIFDDILHSYSQQAGATGFLSASSTSVQTVNMLAPKSDDKSNQLGAGAIAGIVIGALAVVALLACCRRRINKQREDEAEVQASAPPSESGAPSESDVPVANPLVK